MLPANLLAVDLVGGRLIPAFVGPQDEPWLSALLDIYDAHIGKTRGQLDARLAEPQLINAPERALRMARHVLDRHHRSATRSSVPAPKARLAAALAMTSAVTRASALEAAARACQCSVAELEAAFLADTPSAKLVEAPAAPRSARATVLEINLALAAGILRRARGITVQARGHTRQLVRQAQLFGLIVDLGAYPGSGSPGSAPLQPPSETEELRITGPLGLFRHTLVYGRALASLIPRLGWCEDFKLKAVCALSSRSSSATDRCLRRDRQWGEFILSHRDPLPWCREPSRFDSRLEERFARELRRSAPDWDLIREPIPLRLMGRFVFPDFELVHRRDASRRFLIEIAGYYTAEYIKGKLSLLDASTPTSLLLCVDVTRCCAQVGVPLLHPRLLTFKRQLSPKAVLARLGIH